MSTSQFIERNFEIEFYIDIKNETYFGRTVLTRLIKNNKSIDIPANTVVDVYDLLHVQFSLDVEKINEIITKKIPTIRVGTFVTVYSRVRRTRSGARRF